MGRGKNVTVYVPDELAKDMEQMLDVNWSEVCRRAIVDYIGTRLEPNIEAIIMRLRQERTQEYARGYRLALEFVKTAPYREVARLVEGWEDKRDEISSLPLKDSSMHEHELMSLRLMEWRRYWRAAMPGPEADVNEEMLQGYVDALYEVYRKVSGRAITVAA